MSGEHHGFIPSSAEDVLRRRVKAELRKRMRGLRSALPASACAERSSRIVARVASIHALTRPSPVPLFWPMEHRHAPDLPPLDAILPSACCDGAVAGLVTCGRAAKAEPAPVPRPAAPAP